MLAVKLLSVHIFQYSPYRFTADKFQWSLVCFDFYGFMSFINPIAFKASPRPADE